MENVEDEESAVCECICCVVCVHTKLLVHLLICRKMKNKCVYGCGSNRCKTVTMQEHVQKQLPPVLYICAL